MVVVTIDNPRIEVSLDCGEPFADDNDFFRCDQGEAQGSLRILNLHVIKGDDAANLSLGKTSHRKVMADRLDRASEPDVFAYPDGAIITSLNDTGHLITGNVRSRFPLAQSPIYKIS